MLQAQCLRGTTFFVLPYVGELLGHVGPPEAVAPEFRRSTSLVGPLCGRPPEHGALREAYFVLAEKSSCEPNLALADVVSINLHVVL